MAQVITNSGHDDMIVSIYYLYPIGTLLYLTKNMKRILQSN